MTSRPGVPLEERTVEEKYGSEILPTASMTIDEMKLLSDDQRDRRRNREERPIPIASVKININANVKRE